MKRLAALLMLASTSALAYDPVQDTRSILAGTVTTARVKNEYLSGARDGTTAFKGALAAYKAVRAAEAPVPAPAITGWLPSPTLAGLAPIADDFDPALAVVSTAIPPTQDVEGAFRFVCQAGQIAMIDPIVNPGGRSMHLHQFFGNTNVQADSSYASYRAAGGSTCEVNGLPGIALNRSAYWMPAMLNGKGQVVKPDYVSIYYKRRPASATECTIGNPQAVGQCVDLPHGLRFVFGRDPTNPSAAATGSAYYGCDGPGGGTGRYENLVTAQANCPATARLGAVIQAPRCWDGKNLDSPDHRSHVAYASRGDWGYLKCPDSHPKVIPDFTLGAWYTQAEGEVFSLSSDAHMTPNEPRGSSLHSDFDMAWSPVAHRIWLANCINKSLNCNAGDMGNGQRLIGAGGAPWKAEPRLVPVP